MKQIVLALACLAYASHGRRMQNRREQQSSSSYQDVVGSQRSDDSWNDYQSLIDFKRAQSDQQLDVLAKALLAFSFPTPQASKPIPRGQKAASARRTEPRSSLFSLKKKEKPARSEPRFTMPSFRSKPEPKATQRRFRFSIGAKSEPKAPLEKAKAAPLEKAKTRLSRIVGNVGQRIKAVRHGNSKSELPPPSNKPLKAFFEQGISSEAEDSPSHSDATSDSDGATVVATAGTLVGAGVAGAAVGGVLADMAVGVTSAGVSGEVLADAAAVGAVALGGAAVYAASRPDEAGEAARLVGNTVAQHAGTYAELASVKAELAMLEQQEKLLNLLDPDYDSGS
mmetsp:Transcript_127072/g.220179  ORF Transcript_127072/g.220179 Transcript_127072/m.220179 type:complete len:339 (+) Transcript_127072:79-1095(+)